MGKAKSVTKTLSFSEEYMDVYEHLMKQDNASKYVCRLVRKDIKEQEAKESGMILENKGFKMIDLSEILS